MPDCESLIDIHSVVYAYITRYFSTSPLSSVPADSPDYEEMKRVVSKLVPFLTERRSTILYTNVSSMVTDIWSRFEAVGHLPTRTFLCTSQCCCRGL